MARNHIVCHAPAEAVFAVLADPRPYAYFVVGTRKIRRFHPRWPEPGSVFHHSLGVGVTLIRDRTESLAADPPRRLDLRARMRPLSVNEIVFEITPARQGTVIHMEERAVAGAAAHRLIAPLADRLLYLRNKLLLQRLAKVAEARRLQTTPTAPLTPADRHGRPASGRPRRKEEASP